MPLSPSVSHATGNTSETFESAYRTDINYKAFGKFLNKPLTVRNQYGTPFASFSLVEILRHLDIKESFLKGSTVHNWNDKKSTQPPADLDVQCVYNSEGQQTRLLNKLMAFLKTKSTQSEEICTAATHKNWFSNVAYNMQGAWARLVVSVGYPGAAGTTTLDLNFTSRPYIAHDTINASKAIQFNWHKRAAATVDSWHPDLLHAIREAKVMWFNPDIDDGLGRLSYRLCKLPDTRLLQPGLAHQFCAQADQKNISNVYMRVLADEYPNARLSHGERAGFWDPILDEAAVDTKGKVNILKEQMLMWSQCKTLEELKAALQNPGTVEKTLQTLKNATQVSIDFSKAVREVLGV